MVNLIKTDLKVLFSRIEFKLALFFAIFLVCGHFIFMCIRFYGKDISDVFQASDFFIQGSGIFGTLLYGFLFPLIAAFSYSDIFLVEKSNNLYTYYVTRTTKAKYFISKIITVSISGSIIILIPLLISFILSFILGPVHNNIDSTNVPSDYYQPITDSIMFPSIYVSNPYVHNIIFIIIPCIFGVLFALFSFAISTIRSANKIFVLVLPTIILSVYTFIAGVLRMENYSIVRHLYAASGIEGLNLNGLLVALLVLFVPIIFILTFKFKEREIL